MNLKEEGGWSRQQTLKLISEFKEREFLYKVTHPDYLKVHKKREALEEIAAAIQDLKPNITAADIKRKIKVLQQQISQEKKKLRAATRSGMSAEDVYISKLWCFNELKFLLDANDEIRGQSNLEFNTIEDSLFGSECSQSSKKAKRSRLDEVAALRRSANKSMEVVTSFIQKRSAVEETKEEFFCKMLCCELKELKLTESYENVTTEIMQIVRRSKADERKRLSWQLPREATQTFSDPCSSDTSSLQSSSLHSSVSSIDEYNNDSLHNETLVMETMGIESFDNETFEGGGVDFIEDVELNNNISERVEIQSVEILGKNDILQQAFQSIFD